MKVGNDSDRDWERFGREDPYYGVYADPRFRREKLTPGALAEFFDSGRAHVDAVFAVIEASFTRPFRPRRALDFGCGVGRVLLPLAARCEEVVGVDVSGPMLAEAAKNVAAEARRNIRLSNSDDRLSAIAGTFDLIHAFIVFQHVPPRRGEELVLRLLERLDEGGIGVLHVTFDSEQPLRSRLVAWGRRSLPLFHGLWNWRHGKRFDAPWMQMNRYDQNRLLRILQDAGCHRVELRFTNHFGHRGVVLFFQKTMLPSCPGPTGSDR